MSSGRFELCCCSLSCIVQMSLLMVGLAKPLVATRKYWGRFLVSETGPVFVDPCVKILLIAILLLRIFTMGRPDRLADRGSSNWCTVSTIAITVACNRFFYLSYSSLWTRKYRECLTVYTQTQVPPKNTACSHINTEKVLGS